MHSPPSAHPATFINPTPVPRGRASPFIRDLVIDHGPRDILGRFFLRADEAARERGVTLAFASLEDMKKVNAANRDTWGDLMPMFDTAHCDFADESALCILGYDANGQVVATQAARHYDLTNRSLRSVAEDLNLFYGTRRPPPEAHCTVTAANAEAITDSIVYSGSGWYRPDYRRCGLSTLLPRISRAYALAKWDTQYTVSFVEWILVQKGVTGRYGYHSVEDGVEMQGIVDGIFAGGVAWMNRTELLDDLTTFSPGSLPQIDARIAQGG